MKKMTTKLDKILEKIEKETREIINDPNIVKTKIEKINATNFGSIQETTKLGLDSDVIRSLDRF